MADEMASVPESQTVEVGPKSYLETALEKSEREINGLSAALESVGVTPEQVAQIIAFQKDKIIREHKEKSEADPVTHLKGILKEIHEELATKRGLDDVQTKADDVVLGAGFSGLEHSRTWLEGKTEYEGSVLPGEIENFETKEKFSLSDEAREMFLRKVGVLEEGQSLGELRQEFLKLRQYDGSSVKSGGLYREAYKDSSSRIQETIVGIPTNVDGVTLKMGLSYKPNISVVFDGAAVKRVQPQQPRR